MSGTCPPYVSTRLLQSSRRVKLVERQVSTVTTLGAWRVHTSTRRLPWRAHLRTRRSTRAKRSPRGEGYKSCRCRQRSVPLSREASLAVARSLHTPLSNVVSV